MATNVNLDKNTLQAALEQAIQLRTRNAKAATNSIIKEALESEITLLRSAINTMQTIPERAK